MKKILFIAAALLSAGTIYAQKDSLNAVIQVENSYNPVVTKATKVGFTPTTDNTVAKPLELIFTQQATPFKEFTSERDVTDVLPTQNKCYPGYARIGYGTGHNTDAKLFYTYDISKRDKVSAEATFNGYNTNINGVMGKWDSRMFTSAVGAAYAHRFDALHLNVAAGYGNNVFNYQMWTPCDKQNVQRGNASVKGKSILAGAFSYEFDASFSRINYKHSPYKFLNEENIGGHVAENKISLSAQVKYESTEEVLRDATLGIKVDNYNYSGRSLFNNQLAIELNPHINARAFGTKIRAGFNLSLITENGGFFAIAPDIATETSVNDKITFYTSIKGRRTATGIETLEQLTPYWNATSLAPQYTIGDITAGVRLSYESFSAEAFLGYAYTKDALLPIYEVADYDKGVASLIAQESIGDAYIGMRTAYDYEGWLKGTAETRYNAYHGCDKILLQMKPKFELSIGAEARVMEELYVSLAYNLATYDNDVPSLNKNELNMRTSYKFLDRFSAYIEGNNLLNRKYMKHAGYYEQGINLLLGVSASF